MREIGVSRETTRRTTTNNTRKCCMRALHVLACLVCVLDVVLHDSRVVSLLGLATDGINRYASIRIGALALHLRPHVLQTALFCYITQDRQASASIQQYIHQHMQTTDIHNSASIQSCMICINACKQRTCKTTQTSICLNSGSWRGHGPGDGGSLAGLVSAGLFFLRSYLLRGAFLQRSYLQGYFLQGSFSQGTFSKGSFLQGGVGAGRARERERERERERGNPPRSLFKSHRTS